MLDSTLARRAYYPNLVVAGEDAPGALAAHLDVVSANPFAASVRLRLVLPAAAAVRAEAFDALGCRVLAVLFDGEAAAGSVALTLRGRGPRAGRLRRARRDAERARSRGGWVHTRCDSLCQAASERAGLTNVSNRNAGATLGVVALPKVRRKGPPFASSRWR